MTPREFVFNDGAAYDRRMGLWRRLVVEVVLDWLAPAPERAWANAIKGRKPRVVT